MTPTQEAAMRQALEAMSSFESGSNGLFEGEFAEEIAALRAALEEPEQEPVAWMVYTLDGKSVCVTDNPDDFTEQHKALPLYTAPPQRKPLTTEQVELLWFRANLSGRPNVGFAREIEKAHGIV